MTTVYRVVVSPTVTGWGLMSFEKVATLHELPDGRKTVLDSHGGQPADGWHASRREAYLEATAYVQKIIDTLKDQVDRFVAEASK